MGKPAARVGDMHTCPMSDGSKPHVGGPIMPPGASTILIGGVPAAVAGGQATCVGTPDSLVVGSGSVFFENKPAVRQGEQTAHGGVVTVGYPSVLIGG